MNHESNRIGVYSNNSFYIMGNPNDPYTSRVYKNPLNHRKSVRSSNEF